MAYKTVNLNYDSAIADAKRRQKYAELLQEESRSPIEIQSYKGIQAPIATSQGLAKMLNAAFGGYMEGKASSDEEEATAAETAAINEERARIFARNPAVAATEASQGDYIGDDAEGVPNYNVNAATPGKPASYILDPESQMDALYALGGRSSLGEKAADRYLPFAMNRLGRADAERDRADALALQKRPVFRPRTEYGGDLVNPDTQEIIQSFPSNERTPVPGHITLGGSVYIENSDGTPGAYIGPAPTGGGANVDINMLPGPRQADELIGKMYAEYVTGDTASSAKDMNQLALAINAMQQDPKMFGNVTGILPIKIRALFPSLKPGANVQQMVQDVVQKNLRRILGAQYTAKEGEGLMDRILDPQQPTLVDVDRATRLLQSIQEASQAKDDVMRYFGKNNTITGYIPKFPMVRSVEDILFNAGVYGVDATGQAPKPPGPAAPGGAAAPRPNGEVPPGIGLTQEEWDRASPEDAALFK